MMIKPEQIPDEVVEAMMQPLTYPMGTLPATIHRMRLVAALNAWPKSLWDYAREDGNCLIFPLSQENNT